MTFTSGVPTTGQTLGQTRDIIRNNFTNYFNVVSQDHISPNATGEGKHNKSTYVAQTVDPVTALNEIAEYSKNASGIIQGFLAPSNAGTPIQMTRLDTGALNNSNGYSFLPGGLIIQWAALSAISNNQEVTFPIAFPTACFVVVPGGGRSASSSTQPTINFDQHTLTRTGFNTAIIGTQPINYYYIAIGN